MEKPARTLRWAVGKAPLLLATLLIAQVAGGAAAQDEVYAHVLGNSTDRAIVTVTRTTEGLETIREQIGENGGNTEYEASWRWEPTTLTAVMVSYSYWSTQDVRVNLVNWSILYDQMLATRQQMLQYPDTPMGQVYADPNLDRTYEAVERYSADVELLLRVLTGIEYFGVMFENYPNRVGPLSDPPQLVGGQASARVFLTGVAAGVDEGVSESTADSAAYQVPQLEWDLGDGNAAAQRAGVDPAQFGWALSNMPLMSMVLWRYEPADMARVAELIENIDEVTADLHWDPPQMDDPNFQVVADQLANYHNTTFEAVMVRALREVVRYAWALGPQEAPAGFWTRVDPEFGYEIQEYPDQPPDPFTVYYMAADAPLVLPDLPGDRIAMLKLPVDGLAPHQPVGPIFKSEGISTPTFEPTYNGGYWIMDAERVATVGLPERERHRFSGEFMGPFAFSNLNIAGNGVLEGSFTIVYRYVDDTSGNIKTHLDHEYKINVMYSIAIEDGDREDFTIPITLSFARRVEGEIVPLTAPLHYGDGFYVEARLEEPATRQAYSVDLALNGISQKVILTPVEEGGLLLRSEMLYLIWDVPAERAGVALPSRLAP